MYLIDEKRCHKFSWFEDIHDFADKVVIGRLGEVGFKADIGELWFRGDVDRPVSSLKRQPISITLQNTEQLSHKKKKHAALNVSLHPFSFHSWSIHKG